MLEMDLSPIALQLTHSCNSRMIHYQAPPEMPKKLKYRNDHGASKHVESVEISCQNNNGTLTL